MIRSRMSSCSAQDFLISSNFTAPTPSTSIIRLGRFVQDLEGLFPEFRDDALGQDRADALDQAAGQKFFDTGPAPAGRQGRNVSALN